MDRGLTRQFVHRDKGNGTFDSICRECFRTVGTAQWEAELDKAEGAHACDPSELEHIAELIQESEARNSRMPVQRETGRPRARSVISRAWTRRKRLR